MEIQKHPFVHCNNEWGRSHISVFIECINGDFLTEQFQIFEPWLHSQCNKNYIRMQQNWIESKNRALNWATIIMGLLTLNVYSKPSRISHVNASIEGVIVGEVSMSSLNSTWQCIKGSKFNDLTNLSSPLKKVSTTTHWICWTPNLYYDFFYGYVCTWC